MTQKENRVTQVAAVTGAGSGMGRVLATRLAQRGMQVLALDRDEVAVEELAAEVPGVTAWAVDVTDPEAVREALGSTAYDLVITAAGIGHTGRIDATAPGVHRRIMDVNYLGTINTVAAALPAMEQAGAGRVVVFASIAGWVPTLEHAPYGASKAALVFWAQVLRRELRPRGIGVTCVCPSAVATPLLDDMPAAKNAKVSTIKPASPEQIADAVLAAVDKGRFWVFPREARPLQFLQRHFPRTLGVATDRLVGTSA